MTKLAESIRSESMDVFIVVVAAIACSETLRVVSC
jgi:hypothetical protein